MTLLEKARLQTKLNKANTRLRTLEKSGISNTNAYQSIERKAFDNKAEIFGKTQKGQIKFRSDISRMTDEQIKQLTKEVETFLNAKTSTVTGTKDLYHNNYLKYKEKTGSNMSFSDYNTVWSSAQTNAFKSFYGSQETDTTIKKLEALNMSGDEILQFLTDEYGNTPQEIEQKITMISKTDTFSDWTWEDLFN